MEITSGGYSETLCRTNILKKRYRTVKNGILVVFPGCPIFSERVTYSPGLYVTLSEKMSKPQLLCMHT